MICSLLKRVAIIITDGGWNLKAFFAWIIAGIFSVATVWHPALTWMGGYAWIIGAALGAILHYLMSNKR